MGFIRSHPCEFRRGRRAGDGRRNNRTKKQKEPGAAVVEAIATDSGGEDGVILETIWLKLTLFDKAVIGINLILLTVYLVSRHRKKKRALAVAERIEKKPSE